MMSLACYSLSCPTHTINVNSSISAARLEFFISFHTLYGLIYVLIMYEHNYVLIYVHFTFACTTTCTFMKVVLKVSIGTTVSFPAHLKLCIISIL